VAHAWMPGARCIRAGTDGGPLQGGAPRAVWLTLGGDGRKVSVLSAAQRLVQYGRSCHLVWDPLTGEIVQLISVLRAGCALGAPERLDVDPDHGPPRLARVNAEGRICVQIGVLGRPWEPFTDGPMVGLAAILNWMDSWNIPRQWPAGRPVPFRDPDRPRSRALWARGGHFGASQVPGCDSLGPGGIDTEQVTGTGVVPVCAVSAHALAASAQADASGTMTAAALRLGHLPERDVTSAALTSASR
jgi:hypothetical protein